MLLVLRRWHPRPEIVAVADRAYASLILLDRCSRLRDPIIFVTRLRLDAALYEPAFQEEARTHLGFETQRQWSEMAIRRTTPALLGLFSLVTVFAHRRMAQAAGVFRQAACYRKRHPTFADALAMVRKELRAQEPWTFCGSPSATDTTKVPRAYVERLTEAVCYAA